MKYFIDTPHVVIRVGFPFWSSQFLSQELFILFSLYERVILWVSNQKSVRSQDVNRYHQGCYYWQWLQSCLARNSQTESWDFPSVFTPFKSRLTDQGAQIRGQRGPGTSCSPPSHNSLKIVHSYSLAVVQRVHGYTKVVVLQCSCSPAGRSFTPGLVCLLNPATMEDGDWELEMVFAQTHVWK